MMPQNENNSDKRVSALGSLRGGGGATATLQVLFISASVCLSAAIGINICTIIIYYTDCMIIIKLLIGVISTDIFQSPQNATVFQDHFAVFECEVNGEFAGWRVNATPFNSLPSEIREDMDTDRELSDEGNELLILIVPGRAWYNGTTVQCITGIIGGGAVLETETATMKIQGIVIYYYYLQYAYCKCCSQHGDYTFGNLFHKHTQIIIVLTLKHFTLLVGLYYSCHISTRFSDISY